MAISSRQREVLKLRDAGLGAALGDEPDNLLVKDTHFGTVYNGLWLNSLIAQLNARFGLGFFSDQGQHGFRAAIRLVRQRLVEPRPHFGVVFLL